MYKRQPYGVGKELANAAPLIMTGLSVAFAFKTGLFNIGAAGQYLSLIHILVYHKQTQTGSKRTMTKTKQPRSLHLALPDGESGQDKK